MDTPISDNRILEIKKWLGSGSINIFGLPFAGKDTQARRIGELLNAPVVGSGDILRNHHDQEKIRDLMSTGKLFPTDFYLSVVLPYLKQDGLTDKPLVLSSVGRWDGEQEAVMKAAEEAGHPIKVVVFLDLDEELVWERFKTTHHIGDRGKRHDDAEHLIDTRLEEFRTKTLPVIEYYRKLGPVVEVDGRGDPDTVTKHIIENLSKHIQ